MHKTIAILLFAATILSSCGVDSKHFRIEGRILNINQGAFYVYDDEGAINGIDTIKLEGGRFAYEIACERPTTLMLVFPNFSEQPIFAEPGKEVKVKGDASHLKNLKVEGTKTNELMNKFREQIASASPPEAGKFAAQFVADHPESPVGVYLVKHYFVASINPNYKEATRLLGLMQPKQPKNGQIIRMTALIKNLAQTQVGNRLPTFTAYDTRGRLVSSADLSSGLAVVCTWASWSYESTEQLRAIRRAQQKSGGRLKVVSIALDASKADIKNSLERDSISWPNVCDGMMFESKTVRQLGMAAVPDNMLIKNGRIIARGLKADEIEAKIAQNL